MKMITSTAIAGGLVAAASLTIASAQTTRPQPNPWLDCGIGAMIFPDDNLEVGAGISNIIWDLGTTAVISAASSPDSCAGLSNVTMAAFIQRSYDTLEVELAKGEGEHLTALAELVGAADEAGFVDSIRERMAADLTSGDLADAAREEKAAALYFAALDVVARG